MTLKQAGQERGSVCVCERERGEREGEKKSEKRERDGPARKKTFVKKNRARDFFWLEEWPGQKKDERHSDSKRELRRRSSVQKEIQDCIVFAIPSLHYLLNFCCFQLKIADDFTHV